MSEQKTEKKAILIRVTPDLYDGLFSESVDEAGRRRVRVSVPSLVVEKLEAVQRFSASELRKILGTNEGGAKDDAPDSSDKGNE